MPVMPDPRAVARPNCLVVMNAYDKHRQPDTVPVDIVGPGRAPIVSGSAQVRAGVDGARFYIDDTDTELDHLSLPGIICGHLESLLDGSMRATIEAWRALEDRAWVSPRQPTP